MGQLNFAMNYFYKVNHDGQAISNNTLSFVPFNVYESISLNTVNIKFRRAAANTVSLSLGLYSLNVSTLSIVNSLSVTAGLSSSGNYVSLTNTSADQNITPGTWYFGVLISAATAANAILEGVSNLSVDNAFPGGFIGGRMTASTAALPAAYSTSDLDITGSDAIRSFTIILSA